MEVDGDSGFAGIDMTVDPSNLAPGFLAYAENIRLDYGVIEPRAGAMCMHWGVTSDRSQKPTTRDHYFDSVWNLVKDLSVPAAGDTAAGTFGMVNSLMLGSDGEPLRLPAVLDTYDNNLAGAVYNSSCWASTVDFTSVVVAHDHQTLNADGSFSHTHAQQMRMTLIADRIVVGCSHSAVPIGTKIKFVNVSGTQFEYTITAARAVPGHDIKLHLLNADVDSSITRAAIFSRKEIAKTVGTEWPLLTNKGAVPVVQVNQYGQAMIFGHSDQYASQPSFFGDYEKMSTKSSQILSAERAMTAPAYTGTDDGFWRGVLVGDSGSPLFFIDGTTPVLAGLVVRAHGAIPGIDNSYRAGQQQFNQDALDETRRQLLADASLSLTSSDVTFYSPDPDTLRRYDEPEIDVQPFEKPVAVGKFRDPLEAEVVMVATETQVYRVYPDNTARLVPLPDGETVGKQAQFVQAFDRLFLLRGSDQEQLVLSEPHVGFEKISDIDHPADGTDPMPNSASGIYLGNRMFAIHGRDQVAASDLLAAHRYDAIRNVYRINQGSSDKLTAIANVDQATVALFKEHSVYLARNVQGDLSQITLEEMTRAYGCIAPRSVCRIGRDIAFLAHDGLRLLSITEQGQIQGLDVPISDPIKPVFDQLNYAAIEKVRCAFHDNKLYVAAPISFQALYRSLVANGLTAVENGDSYNLQVGGSNLNLTLNMEGLSEEENNVILVYDLKLRAWVSVDKFADGAVVDFVTCKFANATRLFFMSSRGFFYLYDDESFCPVDDHVREVTDRYEPIPTPEPVAMTVLTRGYHGTNAGYKRFHRVDVNYQQRAATVSITAKGDGVNDDTQLTDKLQANRTQYVRPFDAADYDLTNSNDDHRVEGREDYSVKISDLFSVRSGLALDAKQSQSTRKPLRKRGNSVQLKIENTGGDVRIKSASISATADDVKTVSKL